MGLRTSIRRQFAKLFGTYNLQNDVATLVDINKKLLLHLQQMQAMNALNAPCVPSIIKDNFYLHNFPSPGGIRFSSSASVAENIRKFLHLIRPIAHPKIKLRRFGGEHDGGYVMAIPPHLSDTLGGISLCAINNPSFKEFTSTNLAQNTESNSTFVASNANNDSHLNNAFTPPPPFLY